MTPKLKINSFHYDNVIKKVSDSFDAQPLFVFRFNLSRENEYITGGGGVSGKTLRIATESGNTETLSLEDIEDIEYIQYVGCAAIEYSLEGKRFELCRSDMKMPFHCKIL